jgi:hypothetical protein
VGQSASLSTDFEKSCDSVAMEVLVEFGISMKLASVIKMCSNETYKKGHTYKNLSEIFPIQNGLKLGDASLPLLFHFAIRTVQENREGLRLNGTHQFLLYADDINLLGDKINITEKITESLITASKNVSLEENTEKTKNMLMSRHQAARKIMT